MERVVEYTEDGSATLFVPELNEHYHSTKGARTESQHIFIDMGFRHSSVLNPHILEIGFGTGLNAYLTLLAAEETGRSVHYTGIELYPLTWETVKKLDYSDNEHFCRLHTSPWEEDITVTPRFTLRKMKADFTTIRYPGKYDIIYFDAFSPEKQPDMWQLKLFEELFVVMNKGGILTTYCSKGIIRRMLQHTGFKTERLPGPPDGKREILRAIKF